MRGDLCKIWYDAGKERVKYVFGIWIKGLEETDVGVDINFSDGRSENFDLVVGADGFGSHTRKIRIRGYGRVNRVAAARYMWHTSLLLGRYRKESSTLLLCIWRLENGA